MKRKRRTKVWLAGLLGAVFIGMSGACGGETENEPVDRSMTITEDVMGNPKELEESDEQAVIAGIISTPEEEAEVTKDIVSEPTATPVLTMAPTSIPKPTLEPTSTPAPTSEPTSTPEPTLVPTPKPTNTPVPTAEPEVEKSVVPTGTDYILNTNTYKFHYPSCSSVKQMKDENKAYFTGTREECIDMGYDSCGRCKP